MGDWVFAQTDTFQQLAQLHMFCVTKTQAGREVEFVITVKEFVTPKEPTMKFFAQTDKSTNQRSVPYRPSGWGRNLLEALSECVKAIDRFPYEGEDLATEPSI